MITRRMLPIHSTGFLYSENITERVDRVVYESGVEAGLVNVVLQHTTGAVLLMEHETGVLVDVEHALERFLPGDTEMFHHRRGVDLNGRAHVLSSLFSSTVTLPVEDRKTVRGEFQDVVFVDFQPDKTMREIMVTIMGDVQEAGRS